MIKESFGNIIICCIRIKDLSILDGQNKDNLKRFATEIPGLDLQKFNSCFDSQKNKPVVESDVALADSLGFTQTPSFIIVKSDGSNPQKCKDCSRFQNLSFC